MALLGIPTIVNIGNSLTLDVSHTLYKQVMDSTSKVQMDYICQGYYRFAKWMERLAQGIADGVIEVSKDH